MRWLCSVGTEPLLALPAAESCRGFGTGLSVFLEGEDGDGLLDVGTLGAESRRLGHGGMARDHACATTVLGSRQWCQVKRLAKLHVHCGFRRMSPARTLRRRVLSVVEPFLLTLVLSGKGDPRRRGANDDFGHTATLLTSTVMPWANRGCCRYAKPTLRGVSCTDILGYIIIAEIQGASSMNTSA